MSKLIDKIRKQAGLIISFCNFATNNHAADAVLMERMAHLNSEEASARILLEMQGISQERIENEIRHAADWQSFLSQFLPNSKSAPKITVTQLTDELKNVCEALNNALSGRPLCHAEGEKALARANKLIDEAGIQISY